MRKLSEKCVDCGADPGEACWDDPHPHGHNLEERKKEIPKHLKGLDQFIEGMKSPQDAVNHLIQIGVLRDDVVLSAPLLEDDCPECDGVGDYTTEGLEASLPCCQECGGSGKRDLTPLREKLAEYAHDAWSGWMRHLFRKCETPTITAPGVKDTITVIPQWAVDRWSRQMTTRYQDLPEEEKSSDRDEADKILGILRGMK